MTFHKTTEEKFDRKFCFKDAETGEVYDDTKGFIPPTVNPKEIKNFISKNFIDKRIIEEESEGELKKWNSNGECYGNVAEALENLKHILLKGK